VPRVFIGGKFIGGGDDTARMDKENKLKPMLENAGAI
jgi:glutaredoxin 3